MLPASREVFISVRPSFAEYLVFYPELISLLYGLYGGECLVIWVNG